MSDRAIELKIAEAANAVASARALLITAGAGMGVDSGLPDFRGDDGFWNAYPPYKKLGLRFSQMANPRWFRTDPEFAWGFYGHRLNLYRQTIPHPGFAILRRWAEQAADGHFVFTSNVDGQFQRAGFGDDRVFECHGSLHFLQCTRGCGSPAFSADRVIVQVDETSFRATAPLPKCPACSSIARPNVLMFGDGEWDDTRSRAIEDALEIWLRTQLGRAATDLVIIECGAGKAVPTVRMFGESLAARGAKLVRINVREPHVPRGQIGISLGAKEALTAMDARLSA